MRVLVLGHSIDYFDEATAAGIDLLNLLPAEVLDFDGLRLHHDPIIVNDRTSVTESISAIYRAGLQDSIDAVYTNSEQALVTAACLAHLLEAKGLPVRTAIASRDKAFQKSLIRNAGLRVAHSVLADPTTTPEELAAAVQMPAVLKPLDLQGSQRVTRVRDLEHLREILKAYAELYDSSTWLLEEYIAGEEFHLDGIIGAEGVEFFSVSKYTKPLIEVTQNEGSASVTLNPADYPALYERLREFAGSALSTLGLRNSVFHMEVFYTEQEGPTFSECAARCGGAAILPAIKEVFGINLAVAAFQEAVTGEFTPPTGGHARYAGWSSVPVPVGRVTRLPDLDEVESLPGVLDLHMNVEVGDSYGSEMMAQTARAGLVTVTGDSAQDVVEHLEAVNDEFHDETDVLPPQT